MIGLILIIFSLNSCASIGTRIIQNDYNKDHKPNIEKIYLVKPDLINIDFYKQSSTDFYFDELDRILKKYNIESIKMDASILNFDSVRYDKDLNIQNVSNTDYILVGRITRIVVMGRTRDFKIEYKLIDPNDNNTKYYSKYSTTFGKTYVMVPGVGLPSEEQLMRDAIKSGIHSFEKKLLK